MCDQSDRCGCVSQLRAGSGIAKVEQQVWLLGGLSEQRTKACRVERCKAVGAGDDLELSDRITGTSRGARCGSAAQRLASRLCGFRGCEVEVGDNNALT